MKHRSQVLLPSASLTSALLSTSPPVSQLCTARDESPFLSYKLTTLTPEFYNIISETNIHYYLKIHFCILIQSSWHYEEEKTKHEHDTESCALL